MNIYFLTREDIDAAIEAKRLFGIMANPIFHYTLKSFGVVETTQMYDDAIHLEKDGRRAVCTAGAAGPATKEKFLSAMLECLSRLGAWPEPE